MPQQLSLPLTEGRKMLPTCNTCGNTYDPADIRGSHPYRHPVNGSLVNGGEEQAPPREQRLPSDPILRLVLIEKGLITVDDLNTAEAKLMASGMVMADSRGNGDGQQNT